jgi:hypothetical protein
MNKQTTSSCWDSTLPASAKKLSENNSRRLHERLHGTILYFLAFILAICFFSCSQNGQKRTSSDSPSDSSNQTQEVYIRFSGNIGDKAVSMELIRERGYEGEPFFSGYLMYDADEEPIPLYSESGDTLQLLLLESGRDQEQDGRLSGKFSGGVFQGTYTNPTGKKEKFVLTAGIPDGITRFIPVTGDTLFPAFKQAERPAARFSYMFLKPLQKWLQDSLLTEFHGDSLFRLGKGNPDSVFALLAVQYARDYREEVKPYYMENDVIESLNYDLNFGIEVLYNRNQLLSVALTQYTYTGGAHGMMYTRCYSYDLKGRKKFRIQDVFKPGYQAKLKLALNQAAKKKYRVQSLSDALLVDEIEPNDNFFLTGKGICFVYQPYEIGPFSMGEQFIYIPYSNLSDLLK